MQKDKRKSRRRPIRYSAWIALPKDVRHGCLLSDISDTGARIDIEDSETVPDNFDLWLSGTGTARRTCQVVWRKPNQIGVRFERRIAERERAALIPYGAGQAGANEKA